MRVGVPGEVKNDERKTCIKEKKYYVPGATKLCEGIYFHSFESVSCV